jgi:hypothetical protein
MFPLLVRLFHVPSHRTCTFAKWPSLSIFFAHRSHFAFIQLATLLDPASVQQCIMASQSFKTSLDHALTWKTQFGIIEDGKVESTDEKDKEEEKRHDWKKRTIEQHLLKDTKHPKCW